MTDKLKETEDYLRSWLENFRTAGEAAPAVQESLEEVLWARRALSMRPPEAANVSSTQIDDWSAATLESITTALPPMPAYDRRAITAVNSATSSSNTAVMSYIVDVEQLGTPAALSFAHEHVSAYRAIQDRHHRPDHVRTALVARWPLIADRFDAATVAFQKYITATGSDAAAAVEMRTVLDGVQGYLFQDARSTPRENMTWALMAQRVGRDATQIRQLLNQEAIRAALFGHLSGIAKRRAPAATPSLDSLWSMYLDHLQALL